MWHFVNGCVIIHCTGRNLPRFLNLLRTSGMQAEHVHGLPDGGLSLSMRAQDFKRIRPLVRESGCRVHILSRGGLPFFLWRLGRRPVLWVGILLTVCALVFASTRIISIRVEGCKRLPETLVLRALSEHGIERFGPYPQATLEDIGAMMRLFDERIAWVSLELIGSTLRVEVTEMEPSVSSVDSDVPCDVVAVKDGVIRAIEVYAGHSPFRAGDSFAAGDVLIAGEYYPKTNEVVEAPMRVHARGDIKAQVCYFSEYAADATETALLESGKSVSYREVSLWGMILSKSPVPYTDYEIQEVSSRSFSDSLLPIKIVEGRCCELVYRERERTVAEQTELALTIAEQQAYLKIPQDAAVIDKQQRTTIIDGVVIAVVCIVTEETVGLERALEH